MPVERAAGSAAAPTGHGGAPTADLLGAAAGAAAPFIMVGADDAGLCVDGVCALPSGPAQA